MICLKFTWIGQLTIFYNKKRDFSLKKWNAHSLFMQYLVVKSHVLTVYNNNWQKKFLWRLVNKSNIYFLLKNIKTPPTFPALLSCCLQTFNRRGPCILNLFFKQATLILFRAYVHANDKMLFKFLLRNLETLRSFC